MEMKNCMKKVVSLIISILMITSVNLMINLFCNWWDCYHWTNLFNHNIVCHGCINSMKYIKDYQLFIYMTLGSFLASEIKNMINMMDPLNFNYTENEINTPKNDNDKNKDLIPEYRLGKKSPHPRSFTEKTWNANMHD